MYFSDFKYKWNLIKKTLKREDDLSTLSLFLFLVNKTPNVAISLLIVDSGKVIFCLIQFFQDICYDLLFL